MIKKCCGCGIKLQNTNVSSLGYTPNLDNDLCERCFKLKNYNVLTNRGIKIDNEKVIEKINKTRGTVLYLVDFLNIDSEIIEVFKKITGPKYLVITKSDIIPKNIKINVFINNLKNTYDLKEEIIVCSSKSKLNMNILTNIFKKEKKVVLAGFTNAGKSSLINALVGSDITVSNKSNTTQDFIKLDASGVTIYDAPGFIAKDNINSIVAKKRINPITYQLKAKYYLSIGDFKLNIKNDTNLTIYISNEINVLKRKEIEAIDCPIFVPKNSDLVLKGIGFIKFANDSYVLVSGPYEIRKSLVGGKNEQN